MSDSLPIDIRAVSKRYRSGTLANDRISLAIGSGTVYGLLGPNGAGKTTLVRQLLGLLKPTSGEIHVEGVDVVTDPAYARRTIAFLPQGQFNMEGMKVGEAIEGVARLRGMGREARPAAARAIERLDLGPFVGTMLVHASGGVRRLAGFAATIVSGSRILVLDEPTNDIDPARRQLLWSTIAELRDSGATILLVTHNLSEAERVVDRLAVIDGGRILQEGSPSDLRTLVTSDFRVEVTARPGFEPHAAMRLDATAASANVFLVRPSDAGLVTTWLTQQRETGDVLDFRIGPPTLDDIYTAALAGKPASEERQLEAVR